MATPKPGQIRCPTCHQSTPPAAYCTQCGSAVPERARIRPRGLDRDELQSRIRARRSGLPAYRRGEGGPAGRAEPYEPEPEDARALRPTDRGRQGAPLADHAARGEAPGMRRGSFVEEEREAAMPRQEERSYQPDWHDEPEVAAPVAYSDAANSDSVVDPSDEIYVDEDYDQYDYAPDEAYEPYEEERRGSSGLLAVVGFLALGGLALLGGAVLWGLMGGDDDVGLNTATPTPTLEMTPVPTAEETPAQTPEPTPDPGPQETPTSVVFDDGFQAETQPCVGTPDLGQHAQGCSSNGSTNDGTLWVWIGFQRGTDADVLRLQIFDEDDEQVADSTRQLSVINCGSRCNGWTYFNVTGLGPGEYRVEVARNGQFATTTTFTVRS
jgi:hypothetical protein